MVRELSRFPIFWLRRKTTTKSRRLSPVNASCWMFRCSCSTRRWISYASKYLELKAAIEAVQGQIRAESKQLELIQARVRDYRTMQGKGLGIISIAIELEREQARNEGNLSRFEAEIQRLELGLGEIDIKVQDAHNLFTRRVMAELQDTRAKLQEIEATLPTARGIRDLKLQVTGGVAGINAERPRLSIAIVRSRGNEATTLNATEATLLEPGDVVEVRKILPRQQIPIARSETGNDPTRDSASAAALSTNVLPR